MESDDQGSGAKSKSHLLSDNGNHFLGVHCLYQMASSLTPSWHEMIPCMQWMKDDNVSPGYWLAAQICPLLGVPQMVHDGTASGS